MSKFDDKNRLDYVYRAYYENDFPNNLIRIPDPKYYQAIDECFSTLRDAVEGVKYFSFDPDFYMYSIRNKYKNFTTDDCYPWNKVEARIRHADGDSDHRDFIGCTISPRLYTLLLLEYDYDVPIPGTYYRLVDYCDTRLSKYYGKCYIEWMYVVRRIHELRIAKEFVESDDIAKTIIEDTPDRDFREIEDFVILQLLTEHQSITIEDDFTDQLSFLVSDIYHAGKRKFKYDSELALLKEYLNDFARFYKITHTDDCEVYKRNLHYNSTYPIFVKHSEKPERNLW